MTDALYGKARSFMMTHNLELKLPEMLFDGATFRITPRSFEGDGALVKLEMIPKGLEENQPTGRFLLKKISKLIKSKCPHSNCRSWCIALLCSNHWSYICKAQHTWIFHVYF